MESGDKPVSASQIFSGHELANVPKPSIPSCVLYELPKNVNKISPVQELRIHLQEGGWGMIYHYLASMNPGSRNYHNRRPCMSWLSHSATAKVQSDLGDRVVACICR